MNGKELGKIAREAYETVYPDEKIPSQVFRGGNIGLIAIAIAIDNLAIAIKEANLAKIINSFNGRTTGENGQVSPMGN